MDALPFLEKTSKSKRQPVYALIGDETFLKRRVREAIVAAAVGEADPAFAVSVYPSEELAFSTVRNDLATVPFLSPCRLVVVEAADLFVTDNRAALEKYVAGPHSAGILILDVKSFPENTKLAKALPDAAKIVCKAPPTYKLAAWCVGWAKTKYDKKLSADAAELLIQLLGPALGVIDQELDKLATAVGAKGTLDADDVDRLVGRSRGANVFHILNAVGDGKPAAALNILGELFEEGTDPLAVLGAVTFQLRRLAAVGRSLAQGQPLPSAMEDARVPGFDRANCEKQIRHLGLRRLEKLADWLLEINYGVKGGNALPPRLQLERLVVRLARPREGGQEKN